MATTNVPKMLGVLKQYVYTGDPSDGVAAEFFWDIVVNDSHVCNRWPWER
jgi:DUF1680 family protein